jgi:DNA mismatch endonuclease, patch repair protein
VVETGVVPNLLTDPAERSRMMSRIRSKNTKPELIVFSELRRRGVTFQRHYERAAGSPDIAKPRLKLAVFIDGDFWHGRELERVQQKHGEASTWVRKLRRNMERDIEVDAVLRDSGWKVLRVWESDVVRIRTRESTIENIVSFLRLIDHPQ